MNSRKKRDIFLQQGLPERPLVFLAPMEGVTNELFRSRIIENGAPDFVATEFIRITGEKQKIPAPGRHEGVRLQIQVMAASPEILKANIGFLKARGVLREDDWLDLNVGCPSRRVNAHGAGAALLKDPERLLRLIELVRGAHPDAPLSVKTRLGFESTDESVDLLRMFQGAPIDFLTLHARSRCGAYTEPVRHDLVREFSRELPYPVIANGEIWSVDDALRVLKESEARGLMCGRGVLRDPFLLAKIRAALESDIFPWPDSEQITVLEPALWRPAVQRGSMKDELGNFALRLIEDYIKREQSGKKSIGLYKEFATWFSRNPLVGAEYFQGLKRLQSLEEIKEFSEMFFMAATSASEQREGVSDRSAELLLRYQ